MSQISTGWLKGESCWISIKCTGSQGQSTFGSLIYNLHKMFHASRKSCLNTALPYCIFLVLVDYKLGCFALLDSKLCPWSCQDNCWAHLIIQWFRFPRGMLFSSWVAVSKHWKWNCSRLYTGKDYINCWKERQKAPEKPRCPNAALRRGPHTRARHSRWVLGRLRRCCESLRWVSIPFLLNI